MSTGSDMFVSRREDWEEEGRTETDSRADDAWAEGSDADRRALSARWTVTATLTLTSAAQIGTQDSDTSDQTFERNGEGIPVLHGTTLAGALRSSLRDQLEGFRSSAQDPAVGALFGLLEGDDPHESRLLIFDSVAVAPTLVAVRDGVRIVPETGLAMAHHKYDREISLPGVVFPLRVDLVIPEGESEIGLVGALVRVLEGLREGIRLGARRTRGLGCGQAAEFRAERYDFSEPSEWLRYADSGYGADALLTLPASRMCDAPQTALAAAWAPAAGITATTDQRQQCVLVFDLDVDGTLLIRSPGQGSDAADMVHLTEDGHALLSGTSLAGAFRRQATRALQTLAVPDSMALIDDLFGSVPPSSVVGGAPNPISPRASRIVVSEPQIRNARMYRQGRVKIDRFTGGAMDTVLFDQQPSVGGQVAFEVTIRQTAHAAKDTDIPLMLLAGRDLLESLLTVGGEASVGRGVLCGTLTATLTAPGQPARTYQMTTDAGADLQTVTALDALLGPLLARSSSPAVKHFLETGAWT